MKLLIVEDEKRAREGLQNLIARQYPEINLLPPAVNGREGLALIEKESPDIILTDIRMPDIDGLEMLSLIPKRDAFPYIVVISGFSDFDYARRSIQLGVREYILKPFTADTLHQTMEKAIHSIKSSAALRKLMSGEAGTSADKPSCQFLFHYRASIQEDDIFLFLRKNIIRLIFPGCPLEEHSEPSRRRLSFLVPLEEGTEVPAVDEFIRISTQAYPDGLIGVFCCGKKSSERKALLEEGLMMHRFYELPLLFDARKALSRISPPAALPWQQEKNLLRALRLCEIHQAEEHFREWFNTLRANWLSSAAFSEQVEKLAITVVNTLKEINSEGFSQAVNQGLLDRVQKSQFQSDLHAVFQELFSFFETDTRLPETSSYIVQRALQHVKSHYNEAITLEDTAEMVQVSPEHLSRLFKEETGTGFNSYVNIQKINSARELLMQQGLSIQGIARELGYSSSRYFTRVFKRVTGMTPSEYRELRQNP